MGDGDPSEVANLESGSVKIEIRYEELNGRVELVRP